MTKEQYEEAGKRIIAIQSLELLVDDTSSFMALVLKDYLSPATYNRIVFEIESALMVTLTQEREELEAI